MYFWSGIRTSFTNVYGREEKRRPEQIFLAFLCSWLPVLGANLSGSKPFRWEGLTGTEARCPSNPAQPGGWPTCHKAPEGRAAKYEGWTRERRVEGDA